MLASIMDTILSFLNGILLFLDAMIYSLINWVYQIILILCNADLLKNSFEIDNLVGRIYIIIGVIILFLVAYSLLKSMVNPDEALKGKKSPVTIIRDVLISVGLIALVPTIFGFAMDFQTAILKQNTIGSLILGSSTSVGSSENIIETGGITISTGVLEAFLHPDYSKCNKVTVSDDYPNGYNCDNLTFKVSSLSTGNGDITFNAFWEQMKLDQDLFAITDLRDNIKTNGEITYYWVISTVAGVFVLFVLIQYCFDIAVRAVKIAVYELIAPLPILARILPDEHGGKTFSNWLKATISTYTEVFIRLAILFFAVLLIKIVIQNFPSYFILFEGQAGIIVALFAQMFIILGIILFVKQAPEIIKEITGLDGNKYNPFKSAMQTAALLGGGATAAIRNWNDIKNPDGSEKSAFNRFRSALGGAGSAAFRSMWNRDNVKDPKTMAENATKSAKNAIDAHNRRVARKLRYSQPGESRFNDIKKNVTDWAIGSFESQQKMLEQLNSITKEADMIKANTENAVKDKKYVFSMKDTFNEDGTRTAPEIHTSSTGETFTIDDTTSLSAVESIIKTLNGTGSVEDAKYADKLSNDIQIRAKVIGKRLTKVADGRMSEEDFEMNNIVKDVSGDVDSKKFTVKDKMGVELNQAQQSFETLKDRIAENPTIATFKSVKDKQAEGKVNEDLASLTMDQASDLSDALKMQSAAIQREIALEQDRRKAKDKK